jgi:uncharacterized membrane protein YhhN
MLNHKKYLSFTIFFGILFILNLLFLDVMVSYRGVAKTMIMASLMGFYIANIQKQDHGFLLAMIFALFGDVFLLFDGKTFFLVGLSCFLIMQILYSVTFYKDKGHEKIHPWFLIVILAAIAVLMYMLPRLGDMQIPVSAYAIAIIIMAYFGIHRSKHINGYAWVSVGVVSFIVSDMALAFSTFVGTYPGHSYLVIATYMVAQYCIVRGIVEKGETA